MEAQSPDEFLGRLLDLDPDAMVDGRSLFTAMSKRCARKRFPNGAS
jgi:hypothetical protein